MDVGIISRELGVYPTILNSRLVTAQDRNRYYWSNIKTKSTIFDLVTDIPPPRDRNIVLADILNIPIVKRRSKNIIMEIRENKVRVRKNYINQTDLAKYLKSYKNKTINEIAKHLEVNKIEAEHWFRTDKSGSIPSDDIWFKLKEFLNINDDLYDKSVTEFEIKNGSYDMAKRVYHTDGKHPTLMRITGGHQNKNITDGKDLFYLKIEHWELLQGFNVGYTKGISDNKRKSLLGDGWTLPMIEHIFSFI